MKFHVPTALLLLRRSRCRSARSGGAGLRCQERRKSRRAARALHLGRLRQLPPADRRLSQWKDQAGFAGRLVPLAFHVDYWDRLGWTDRFASPQYTQRQYAMAAWPARARSIPRSSSGTAATGAVPAVRSMASATRRRARPSPSNWALRRAGNWRSAAR
jgi:hypothetical protein